MNSTTKGVKQFLFGPLRSWTARLLLTREIGAFLALLLCVVVFSILQPEFLTPYNLENLFRQVALLGVMSVAATFVLITSEVDLSVGATYGFTGLVTGLMIAAGSPSILAVGVTLIGGLAIGVLNGAAIVYGRVPSFIATLGSLYLIQGIGLVISGGSPVALQSDPGTEWLTFAARGQLLGFVPMQALIFFVVAILCIWLLHRSTFGFHIFAVGGNDQAARIVGVPVKRTKLLAFGFVGLAAALAGILNLAFIGSVTPGTGTILVLDVLAAVIIGGTRLGGGAGSILGTIFGVFLIGVLRNGLVLMGISSFWQTTVIGAVVILSALAGTLVRGD